MIAHKVPAESVAYVEESHLHKLSTLDLLS